MQSDRVHRKETNGRLWCSLIETGGNCWCGLIETSGKCLSSLIETMRESVEQSDRDQRELVVYNICAIISLSNSSLKKVLIIRFPFDKFLGET